ELKKIKNINDEDLIFCVKPEDILFLDIETTGMTGAEIFLIGIGFLSKKENSTEYFFTTELLFAREISEEAAILKYFVDLLPNFKMFVSYNGKGFDIPFICNRIGTLFESKDIEGIFEYFVKNRLPKSPNYEEIEWPLAMIKAIVSGFIHFDLYYAVRRTYKDLLPDHRLVTAEEHILDFFREEHLPSSEVPAVYLDYLSDEKHIYMGALYKVIEHNFYDVINMELLLKEWIILNIQNNYKEIEKQLKNSIKYKPLAQNSLHSLEKIEKLEKYLSLKRGIKMQTLDEFSK
ncbi:MAG: hypothetical protein GY870_09130, partial [archaeon]|nr:hypothetical protein [archaeon]